MTISSRHVRLKFFSLSTTRVVNHSRFFCGPQWIRSEWAFVFQTHCLRHRAPLIERCAVCFVEDPRLPNVNAFSPIPSCWKCGSTLFSYDADERASSIIAEVISLESAILALMTGRPPLQQRRRPTGLRLLHKQFLLLVALAHYDFFGLVSYAQTSRVGGGRCNRFLDPVRSSIDR